LAQEGQLGPAGQGAAKQQTHTHKHTKINKLKKKYKIVIFARSIGHQRVGDKTLALPVKSNGRSRRL
jgi:hypothetical protein